MGAPLSRAGLASINDAKIDLPSNPQGFENGEIHRWYNFVLGFSDKLVARMMDRLKVQKGQLILDPFCGTGTTLVESMKRGLPSVGIDASPFSCFVSRVKTKRNLKPDELLTALVNVAIEYQHTRGKELTYSHSRAYKYLNESGMVKRGWISRAPLRDALALKAAIYHAAPSAAYRDALLLALVSNLSTAIGNMKYGPEIYCGPPKRRVDVWAVFEANVAKMIKDLHAAEGKKLGKARVFRGDARDCSTLLHHNGIKKIHVAISSPPYPAEHDYTRNTRLELAFLDFITSNDCIQSIKRSMIRSHTKGVYKTDEDAHLVRDNEDINALADRVARRCREKTYGFARLYPTVIRQYFGGMMRHLTSASSVIAPGGHYGIVVGDQASYLGTHIPTGDLLGQVAEKCGFVVEDSFVWRSRKPSTKTRLMKEHALILRRVTR
jgi:DNA modification methylase